MNIVPMPNGVKLTEGFVTLDKNTTLSNSFPALFDTLNGFVKKLAGFSFSEGDFIKFVTPSDFEGGDEGYRINVSENGIILTAKGEQGLFYAVQSLKQMLISTFENGTFKLQKCLLTDKPRFGYRGFMLDCARHFFPVGQVKRMIEVCALLKINKFHWHLVDDQGWRFESKLFPLLTEKGSKRTETKGDGKPVEGFYTQDELKDIVAFAKDRFIDIIPEFDLPGHASALLCAYPELSCDGKGSEVETSFGIKRNLVCAGRESTYEFLYKLFDEIVEIFPYHLIHLGGDEAIKTSWFTCPHCQQAIKDNNLGTVESLQAFFTQKMINYLATKGKTVIAWNEALDSGKLDSRAYIQYWLRGKKAASVTIPAINSGRKTVISLFTPYYLDYPYGMHPLRAVYNFEPIVKGITKEGEKSILGIESPMWTEYVQTPEILEVKTFPRLMATAESAWTCSQNKNLKSFKKRLSGVLSVLDLYSIKYTSIKDADVGRLKGLPDLMRFFKEVARGVDKGDYMSQQREIKRAQEEITD